MMPGCHQRRKCSSSCRLQVKLSPVHLGCGLGIFNKSLEGAVAVAELRNGACGEQRLPHHLLASEEVHHIHIALVLCNTKKLIKFIWKNGNDRLADGSVNSGHSMTMVICRYCTRISASRDTLAVGPPFLVVNGHEKPLRNIGGTSDHFF